MTLFQSCLSIIGLGDQGHQPFNKEHDEILVSNGEIYNFKQLRMYDSFGGAWTLCHLRLQIFWQFINVYDGPKYNRVKLKSVPHDQIFTIEQ